MPRAVVLTSVGKAGSTGGTFADTLAALANDSSSVINFESGGARILEVWGIDSDSVAEIQLIATRPESTHDQQHGVRWQIPALIPGGAAVPAAHDMLPGYGTINVYKSDTLTWQATSTAGDDLLVSYVTEYDDMPGQSAVWASWDQVQALQKSAVGIFVNAAAGTPAVYGTQRAINADDDRFHADRWYAILGVSSQVQLTTCSLIGPDWGGQRIGLPLGILHLNPTMYFVDQSVKYGKPLIPCFQANNKASVLVQLADGESGTTPKLDFFLYELTGNPGV